MWLPDWSTFQHGTDDEDRWGLRRASEPCRGDRQTHRQTCRQTDSSLALAYGRWVLLWRALRIFDPSVAASYRTHGTARHVRHDDNTWTFTVAPPYPPISPLHLPLTYFTCSLAHSHLNNNAHPRLNVLRSEQSSFSGVGGGGARDGIDSLQITPIRPIL